MLTDFPTTQSSKLRRLIADGSPESLEELNVHAFEAYRKPLLQWYRTSKYYQRYGHEEESEADEVFSRFSTDRLMDLGYWRKWDARGYPLRNWLVKGCKFTVQEGERQTRRRRKLLDRLVERPVPRVETVDPGEPLERRLVLGLIRASVATVGHETRACEARARQASPPNAAKARLEFRHGRVLIRCCWRGESNQAVARRYGCTTGQVAHSKRTGYQRIAHELERRLLIERVPPSRLQEEIRSILELLGRGVDPE